MAGATSPGPWSLTVVRADGLQHLRAEKSWRPIVSVAIGNHQNHELNLGCDGQNPNLKQCFHFHEMDASSPMDISVYHQAQSKKKHKKRNLVASARFTLRELTHLQTQEECSKKKGKAIEIKLNGVLRQKGGMNKSKPARVVLIVKIDSPQSNIVQPIWPQNDAEITSEISSEELECTNTPISKSSEGSSFVWSEANDPEPRVHPGYWSNSDDTGSEDERDPLLKCGDNLNDPTIILDPHLSDSEDGKYAHSAEKTVWFAASILPTYTETTSIASQTSVVDSIVDSFSPYRTLREARLDSEYERVLVDLCAEWRFVGGSLVALAGLEAGVFGFSSASVFAIGKFAHKAIAVGSVASGLGLTIDAWFLLIYCNATPAKFQKMALDVYGKYLFFCISARIPALCMFTSACALMTFLLSVAWAAWPTAVLVMSFFAGVLVSLQFIVYGIHCVVAVVAQALRSLQKRVVQCFAWICARRPPPPPDLREREKEPDR